jgi:voltage-gated potassium channel
MMLCIILSLVPLAMKEVPAFFAVTETVTTVIFVIDYILRLFTADYKLRRGKLSFLIYPFTPMAIIDLLSVLPTLILISEALRVLKVIRFVRALRVLKILKSFRYSKNIAMIASVFRRERRSLTTVGVLAVGYILISALLVFNVEPETFSTFFDAVYWATVSLTTVGYGDIYTTGVLGRIITMISSVLGVAIVALPQVSSPQDI